MTIVSLRRRVERVEAARFRSDPRLKAMSDEDLAQSLREASDNPRDHLLADWFEGSRSDPSGEMPPGVIATLTQDLHR